MARPRLVLGSPAAQGPQGRRRGGAEAIQGFLMALSCPRAPARAVGGSKYASGTSCGRQLFQNPKYSNILKHENQFVQTSPKHEEYKHVLLFEEKTLKLKSLRNSNILKQNNSHFYSFETRLGQHLFGGGASSRNRVPGGAQAPGSPQKPGCVHVSRSPHRKYI